MLRSDPAVCFSRKRWVGKICQVAGIGLLFSCILPARAADPTTGDNRPASTTSAASTTNANSLVRQTGPGLFEIGKVRLDQRAGTIVFPAAVNLREGPIEYVLVTDYGKIHESLLRTDVDPMHVQLALLLMGAKPRGTNAAAPILAGSRPSLRDLALTVSWSVNGLKGRRRSAPIGDFVRDRRGRSKAGKGQWIFVGSLMRDDGFAAQAEGSIISVIDDSVAIIGSALPRRDDDDNWLAIGKKLPPADAPVEVTLTVLSAVR
jgi:hypothetical protein